jgi:hypothetical protein
MLRTLLVAPSINSLFVTGFFVLIIIVILLGNIKYVMRLNPYQKLMTISLITISIGTHGLLHLGLENVYGFNPYKWF